MQLDYGILYRPRFTPGRIGYGICVLGSFLTVPELGVKLSKFFAPFSATGKFLILG